MESHGQLQQNIIGQPDNRQGAEIRQISQYVTDTLCPFQSGLSGYLPEASPLRCSNI